MGGNLVIAAIPDENDRVWKVSSEKIPHLTILFLGETDKVQNLDQIMLFVEHAANTTLQRFFLPVDRRGELGDDKADVLFFKKGRYDYKAIRDFRATLLQNDNIRTAYDSSTQFEGPWNPHLTLGYPDSPAKPLDDNESFSFFDVQFNKIAIWTGDFEGPDFLLKDYWDEMETLDAVPMDVAMSDIRHHGVKGQRWGVRKADAAGAARSVGRAAKSAGGAVGKAAKATARFAGDVSFENQVESGKAREMVVASAVKPYRKQDLPAVKARHGDYGKLRNRAKKPFSKEARAYRKDARETYIKRLESTANSMTNVSGTRQYTIRERGFDLPSEGGALPTSKIYWDVSSRRVKHAPEDEFTRLEVIFDEEGWITDLKPVAVETSMAQTIDLGAEFLEHYGIRGMHWGVRRQGELTTQTHIDSGLFSRKTKVKATGGEAHPASNDAIRAAVQKQKLKKSGTAALSNQELRELQTRLQLEVQVQTLATKKGQKFVSKQLEEEGKQQFKTGVRRAAPHVVKKARRTAATAAVAAVL